MLAEFRLGNLLKGFNIDILRVYKDDAQKKEYICKCDQDKQTSLAPVFWT